jgi:type IV pilus assembly protein PilW
MSGFKYIHARGSRADGASLLELVVGLAVSLMVIWGVYKAYQASSLTNRTQEALARMQESGRLVLDLLTRDIRMAGYYGCSSLSPILQNNLNLTVSNSYDFATPIQGNEWLDTRWLPSLDSFITSASRGSDVITIRTISGDSVYLAQPMLEASSALTILGTESLPFDTGDMVMVSDCEGATFFQPTQIQSIGSTTLIRGMPGTSGIPGNSQQDMLHPYGEGAEVTKLNAIAYYVRDSNGEPTLHRRDLDQSQAVVPGVENIQILYGVGSLWLKANQVTDWMGVTSVSIGLLLRSEEIGGRAPTVSSHQVLDQTIDSAPDRRLRQVFSTTVAMRNRLQ